MASGPYAGFHLAQANVARMRAALDDPVMAGFVARLDALNAIADASPGFVWRLVEEDGDTAVVDAFGDPLLLFNMSVWESVAALEDYVYRSSHIDAVRRRGEWFERPSRAPFVLWWIEAGRIPDVAEARDRLETLWQHGPTARAFTFKRRFEPRAIAGWAS